VRWTFIDISISKPIDVHSAQTLNYWWVMISDGLLLFLQVDAGYDDTLYGEGEDLTYGEGYGEGKSRT